MPRRGIVLAQPLGELAQLILDREVHDIEGRLRVFERDARRQLLGRGDHRRDLLLRREAQLVEVVGVDGAFDGHDQHLVGQHQGQHLVLDGELLGHQGQHLVPDGEATKRYQRDVELFGHGLRELGMGQRAHLRQNVAQAMVLRSLHAPQGRKHLLARHQPLVDKDVAQAHGREAADLTDFVRQRLGCADGRAAPGGVRAGPASALLLIQGLLYRGRVDQPGLHELLPQQTAHLVRFE